MPVSWYVRPGMCAGTWAASAEIQGLLLTNSLPCGDFSGEAEKPSYSPGLPTIADGL